MPDPIASSVPAVALPAGTPAPRTAHERALWDQARGLESVFAQHLVDEMMKSARGDDDDADGGSQMYRQMADEQLTQAFVQSGSLGLAGAVYSQLRRGS